MPDKTLKSRREKSIAVALLFLFVLLTPFNHWWAQPQSHWFVPYLLWLLAIVLVALIQLLTRRQ
ncbi:MAG: hypothetical protein PVG66_03645 [Chromatiales bacterium]|jgi:hypothetical protein